MRPSISAVVAGLSAALSIGVFLVGLDRALSEIGYSIHPSVAPFMLRPLELACVLGLATAGHLVGALVWRTELARTRRSAQRTVELGDPRGYRCAPRQSWRLVDEAAARARLTAALGRRAAWGVASCLPIFFVGMSRITYRFHATEHPNALDFELYFGLTALATLSHAAVALWARARVARALEVVASTA